ncbi:MAG: Trk family potassium uptake protein [Clostridium sp.]|nr:Trk family potassium uptake protein [Clostridium sp.]MCM1399787.1 Trk family potassium uptake protein [Clostridium sp.]MCM1459586.1 Trk family potassium uptake protein [Bacteroides sp.]
MEKGNIKLSAFQIIILGFLVAIFAGAMLLSLPIATKEDTGADFMDALFTSASAVCVTGLVVQDTATYWSFFGQSVIAILIQIGGIGVVTIAVAIVMLTGRKIGLMQRSTLQYAISAPKVGGIVKLIGFILKLTFFVELTGAVLMAPVFIRLFGAFKGMAYAVFHSISAFCNAGFDLMGTVKPRSSLITFAGEPLINIVIMVLIIIGGIGFITWDDVRTHGIHIKKYRMPCKVILCFTCGFIIVSTLFFYFVEFDKPQWEYLSGEEKVYAAVFQSVAPRTAGFNTVDTARFSDSGQALTIILMLIGAAPGSTAGGMKLTTVAVLFASAISVIRRRDDSQFFGRRMDAHAVKDAAAVLIIYLFLFLAGGFIISELEGLTLSACLFETASAIGTVGLSLGITPELGLVSRIILIVLMFFGRVGGLTILFAAVTNKNAGYRLPKESIVVG